MTLFDMNEYNIGSKIRKLRKDKNLTLKNLAKETRISSAMLSLIENDNSSPSLRTISKLAKYFNVGLSSLFHNEDNKMRYSIFRNISNNITNGISSQNVDHIMITSLTSSKMKCSIIDLVKYCTIAPLAYIRGETFVYIIDGKVEITNRDERYCVEAGDSIYLDNFLEIGMKPIGCSRAKVMRIERE